jgi:hypothetical protein
MALAPVAYRDAHAAASPATFAQRTVGDQFLTLAEKTRISEAAIASGLDGENSSVKGDLSKVQSRSERAKDQGDRQHQVTQTRVINGQRVTMTEGRVSSRVNVGHNGSKGTIATTAITSEPLRNMSLALSTSGKMIQVARSLDSRSPRLGEKIKPPAVGLNGTTGLLNADAGIRVQQNNDSSSGGGGDQQGQSDQSDDTIGGNQGGGDNSGGRNHGNGGIGGGGGSNIGPNPPGGNPEDPNGINFEALKRAAQKAAISEANAMGLDSSQAVRFCKLDPSVRAALRDFNPQAATAMFSELSLNSLDNLAKMLPAGEPIVEIMHEVLSKIRNNASGDEWGGADLLRLLATTQSLLERLRPADRNAISLLGTVEVLTLPPSSPNMLLKIGKALQRPELSGRLADGSRLIEEAAGLADNQITYEGIVGRNKINGPGASQQAAVPKALRDAAIREGKDLGFDPITSFEYSCAELALRPALREFVGENPGLKLNALDIHCLNNIALILPANGPTTETVIAFLRQLLANASISESWAPSDLLKILSTAQNLLEGQYPENRQADTLLRIVNALTAPPATPSRLQDITEALRCAEYSDPAFEYPADIETFIETVLHSSRFDPVSDQPMVSRPSQPAPDSALHSMMQYFLDETPDANFNNKSMDSIFRLGMLLPENEAVSEAMLTLLRKLRANATDERQWLSPELLPIVLGTIYDMFEPLTLRERQISLLLDSVQVLTG